MPQLRCRIGVRVQDGVRAAVGALAGAGGDLLDGGGHLVDSADDHLQGFLLLVEVAAGLPGGIQDVSTGVAYRLAGLAQARGIGGLLPGEPQVRRSAVRGERGVAGDCCAQTAEVIDMSVLIKGGTIVTADRSFRGDILCAEGKIVEIAEGIASPARAETA